MSFWSNRYTAEVHTQTHAETLRRFEIIYRSLGEEKRVPTREEKQIEQNDEWDGNQTHPRFFLFGCCFFLLFSLLRNSEQNREDQEVPAGDSIRKNKPQTEVEFPGMVLHLGGFLWLRGNIHPRGARSRCGYRQNKQCAELKQHGGDDDDAVKQILAMAAEWLK